MEVVNKHGSIQPINHKDLIWEKIREETEWVREEEKKNSRCFSSSYIVDKDSSLLNYNTGS